MTEHARKQGKTPAGLATGEPGRPQRRLVLCGILILAAALRLAGLGYAPPGLNQDEAANAWNAYCMLKTGTDQVGKPWPIFYSRCTGSNNTTLYLYTLLPFQAAGGLNVQTARLPSAVAGTLAVWLLYYIGMRLFSPTVGLVAAAMLAVNPWNVHLSRWGIEGGICPLLGIAPLAAVLWARLLPAGTQPGAARPVLAALAGLLTGVCCYGYWPIRMFIPIFMMLVLAVTWRTWWGHLKSRRGRLSVAAFALGVAATFGPLAYQHATDPEGIGRRGRSQLPWNRYPDASAAWIAKGVALRYVNHFNPEFLFVSADPDETMGLSDWGVFHYYDLPFFLAGLVALVVRRRRLGARLLLVFVAAYPVGDVLSVQGNMAHPLRSTPGAAGLVLLSAVGAVAIFQALGRRRPRAVRWTIAATAAVVIGLNGWFLGTLFGPYSARTKTYHQFMVDLQEACRWLRPRLDRSDAVFCTMRGLKLPHLPMLVHLGYEPAQWFRDKKEVMTLGEFDYYPRFGKVHFMLGDKWVASLRELENNRREDRVVFIVRPGELGLKNPAYEIRQPDGRPVMWICELAI